MSDTAPGSPAPAPDYGLLDRSGASSTIFYPRRDTSPPPLGAEEIRTEVAPGVEIASRFYPADPAFPTILYFHGNGEVAPDYDDTAPFYHRIGCNLWVADFRGYGASSGTPSFAALGGDAHPVAEHFHRLLDARGFSASRFVMGRSLGSHPALELAARQSRRLHGLILESGAANLRRMMQRFGLDAESGDAAEMLDRHQAKIASITLPALIMHGAEDELIPVQHAIELYESLNAKPKQLVIIPGAGHNDILWVGFEQYFTAIARFVGGKARL
ncbi:MAG: alpha/beta hydrolase [Dehalococcoidia bacterium]